MYFDDIFSQYLSGSYGCQDVLLHFINILCKKALDDGNVCMALLGSLRGPFIFNIFSNDLLLLLEKKCHVFTYADDTSILCKDRDYDYAYSDLLSAASTMIHWYKMNYIQANPEKFQFIIFDKERQPRTLQLNHNVTI